MQLQKSSPELLWPVVVTGLDLWLVSISVLFCWASRFIITKTHAAVTSCRRACVSCSDGLSEPSFLSVASSCAHAQLSRKYKKQISCRSMTHTHTHRQNCNVLAPISRASNHKAQLAAEGRGWEANKNALRKGYAFLNANCLRNVGSLHSEIWCSLGAACFSAAETNGRATPIYLHTYNQEYCFLKRA